MKVWSSAVCLKESREVIHQGKEKKVLMERELVQVEHRRGQEVVDLVQELQEKFQVV